MATTKQNVASQVLSISPIATTAGSTTTVAEKVSPTGSSDNNMPVRRSTRDIKRKKFDDEVFETGVTSKSARKHRNSISEIKPMAPIVAAASHEKPEPDNLPTTPVPPIPSIIPQNPPADAVQLSVSTVSPTPLFPSPTPQQSVAPKGKRGRTRKKTSAASPAVPVGPTNAQLQEQAAALKDVGRWQPIDDLALVTAVMQTSDLKAVYTGVKFSCKFTLQEVAERWYALLYDPLISKLSQEAMRQLPPEVTLSIQSNTLFSKNEERLLSSIPSNTSASVDLFSDLLTKHPDGFHPARTPRSLYQHWLNMRQYRLLPDQKAVPLPQGDYVMNFSDLEENFVEADVPPTDSLTERELVLAERHLTRQIRQLEGEMPKWHVLVEYATGVAAPDFDANTVAILRGRLVRYLMRSKEVTMGRSARGYQVDIDLSLEGPAFKVSRKQATIKLRATGEFYMINEGKRPMYIDGKPLLPGSKGKLNNNAVIEISCLRLLFSVNQQLINSMSEESTKMATAS